MGMQATVLSVRWFSLGGNTDSDLWLWFVVAQQCLRRLCKSGVNIIGRAHSVCVCVGARVIFLDVIFKYV